MSSPLRESESGVAVPLAAAIIAGLSTLFVVLAFDVNLGHQGNVIAQKLADDICREGQHRLPYASQAVANAAGLLPSDNELRFGISLQKVQIIFPAILEDPDNTSTIWEHPSGPWPRSFSDLGFASYCPAGMNASSDCMVNGDVTSLTNFPPGILDPSLYNRFLACEVEVSVSPFILGNKVGRGKSVYSLKLRNELLNQFPAVPSEGSVLIGVAPHLSVPPQDGSANPWRDELYRFPLGAGSIDPNVNANSFEQDNPAGELGQLDTKFLAQGSALNLSLISRPIGPGAAETLETLRSGCYNPVVAARNLLLEFLVDALSRTGGIAKSFQLAIVNSQNEDGTPNLPTRVKGPGEKPFEAEYFFPMMNYVSNTLPGGPRYHCGFDHAEIGPLGTGECNSPNEFRRMNQLRACYHVFHGGAEGTNSEGATNTEDAFQPSDFRSIDNLGSGRSYPSAGLSTWDQHQGSGAPNDLLKVTDLVRMLGRVEQCEDGTCSIALEPDIEAFLDYAAYENGLVTPTYYLAWDKLGYVKHPSHPAHPNPTVETSSFLNEDTVTGVHHLSDVVLVLTQLPTLNPSRIATIQNKIEYLNARGVHITVVFFATDPSDETSTVLINLLETFLSRRRTELGAVNAALLPRLNPNNHVIRLRPTNSPGLIANCPLYSGNGAACYGAYYDMLRTAGGETSSQRIAQDIFYSFLFKTGLEL